MKVICDRSALLNATNLMAGVVAQRTPKPQLTCVKLVASKNGKVGTLTLSATDAELSLRLSLAQVDVQQPGEALIPADKLRQITSAEEEDPTLTIETDRDDCVIKGRNAQYRVLGYPASEFPPIPGLDGAAPETKPQIQCPASVLSGMVMRTVFATARETTRYAINGVLLKRDGKKLEMVATDGRRLALARHTLGAGGGDKDASGVQAIIPTKALNTLLKLIHSPEDPVAVTVTANQVLFRIGPEGGKDLAPPAVLASNLVEGAFPPYEEVIPKDQDKRVTFERDALSSAVRRAALLTNEESRGVRFKFVGSDKQLQLSSRAPEMGEANVQVAVNSYEGTDIEIGFNPTFITDALKVISEPEVVLELKTPNRQGLVKTTSGGSDFLYVVMPVNLA